MALQRVARRVASMPLNVFAGIIAGQLRRFAPEQEDIWSFSPSSISPFIA